MPNAFAVLVVLFIVLAVVTLVGHGIWVLLALIFGGNKRPGGNLATCVFCGHKTPAAELRCQWCGRELRNTSADELRDLLAVERQLQRWGHSGPLQPQEVNRLLARVQRDRERLRHPATDRPAPQPVATQPAPRAVEVAQSPATVEAPLTAQVIAAVVEEPVIEPAKPQAAPVAARSPDRDATVVARSPDRATTEPTERHGRETMPQRAKTVPQQAPQQPPPEPAPPRRSWSEMLAGFMEERNIRWGELIGGLLIVGPAIALVISFWDKLAANPYLQLTTFVSLCSAVFGVGLYAHHRWKLRSTSLGLLVIAMLLVPLNFLAMAAVWKQNWGPGTLAADLVSLAIFAWLAGLAGRVLVPNGRWLQVLAVLGGSASVLVAARWLGPDSTDAWYIAAACLPVACFASAVGAYLFRISARRRLDATGAGILYTLLGTAAFAMLIVLGMVVSRSDPLAAALGRISVPVALAGVPILACGLAVRRGVARDPALAGWHVAGTTVSLLGMIVMLAGLGLAWPHPLAIVAVAAIDGIALALAAFRWRLPILHAGAIACATLAYLTGFHVFYSRLPLCTSDAESMLRQLISGPSGAALVGLFVIFAAASELLARRGWRRHAIVYAGGAAVMAVLGLGLATVHGVRGGHDALRAAALCAIYGAGGLATAARWRRVELSYLGLALLAVAPLWVLWGNSRTHDVQPLWAAVLAAEALAMAVAASILRRYADATLYRVPLLALAEIIAPTAMAFAAWTARHDGASIAVGHSPSLVVAALGIAASYMLLAWQHRSPQRTWAGSLVALAGLVHAAVWNYPDLVRLPWPVALLAAALAHSTLAALAAMLLDESSKRRESETLASEIRRVFAKPLGDTAVLSSLLTLPVLPFVSWTSIAPLAGCLFWLAAIWLAIAWRRRNVPLFAAHQLVLALATGAATTAWLKHQPWVAGVIGNLRHPYSLQAYLIALAVLSLLWIFARIALRGNATAKKLLDPAAPAVDRILRQALVTVQLAAVVLYLLPSMGEELIGGFGVSAAFRQMQQATCGGGAWLLLGVLAAMLIAALWQRWRNAELVGSLLLAATVPCLVAGRFANNLAVASALRWGLAVCFFAVAAALWGRKYLSAACRQARMNVDLGRGASLVAHGVSLATAALPVLALTIAAAVYQFAGTKPGGPALNTLFARLGPSVSYLVPLTLVLLAMVGHALRESSAGYAFSAGLVAELIVGLGYSLSVVLDPNPARRFAIPELVTLLQLMTITAAVWALGWLAARQWVNAWREAEKGTVPDQTSFGARRNGPKGAAHKWGLSPFSASRPPG